MNVSPSIPANTKAVRILYIVTLAWWGGAQRYVYDLSLAAHGRGDSVLVLTGEGELATRLREAGIRVVTTQHFARGIRIRSEIRSFFDLMQTIRLFRPDVIHTNSSKAGLLGNVAGRLSGVRRVIFTAHGWVFNEKRPWWQKIIFWLAHYLTIVFSQTTICNSFDTYRGAATMPCIKSKLTVIHNGIEPVDFFSREEARKALVYDNHLPIWIGTIAELHPNKQLETLIYAFSKIALDFPNALLVLVGEGSERQKLEMLAHTEEVQDRVVFCGHMKMAARYLKALDIFVLPSRTESLGYVLLEAGLAELPVAASNVGGIPEIINDDETGFLFPSGNSDVLAALLKKYLSNEGLRARMGSGLSHYVSENFSTETMIKKTFALY